MAKIYLVERDKTKNRSEYDVYNNHIVVATTPIKARELCFEVAADEGEQSWVEAKTTIIGTPKDSTPRIILSDFNAG